MALTLRDSLSGRPHAVRGRAGRPLSLYVCGPTVYDAAHVGHARTYLYFDLVRRALEDQGLRVRHVMNITDVEDKISARAAALGTTWRALARSEERGFLRDLAALGIERPHATPRASAYVRRMAEVARRLERSGRVRRSDEGWIYDPPRRAPGRNFPAGDELARHAVSEPGHPFTGGSTDPREFLLWKAQGPPLPSFPGPWSRGVPGWHLECYTMAQDLLGVPVDVHGGGTDLVFPHHFAENEVAWALDGSPFARTFFHTAFVTANGSKMSKSTGNLVPLAPTLDAVGPGPLRWYLLGTPPSRVLPWSTHALEAAGVEFRAVRSAVRSALAPGAGGTVPAAGVSTLLQEVRSHLADGLLADRALGALGRWAERTTGTANGRIRRGERPAATAAVAAIERLLGLALR